MSSPTARTLAWCRKQGWMATVVERYVHVTKRRHDAFGFGDVLVLDGLPGALMVQCTSLANVYSRLTKIRTERAREAQAWLAFGNRIEVWAHTKGQSGRYELRRWPVSRVDGEWVVTAPPARRRRRTKQTTLRGVL